MGLFNIEHERLKPCQLLSYPQFVLMEEIHRIYFIPILVSIVSEGDKRTICVSLVGVGSYIFLILHIHLLYVVVRWSTTCYICSRSLKSVLCI